MYKPYIQRSFDGVTAMTGGICVTVIECDTCVTSIEYGTCVTVMECDTCVTSIEHDTCVTVMGV